MKLILALLFCTGAIVDEPSIEEQVKTIQKAYDAALAEYYEAMNKAKPEERNKVYQEKYPEPAGFIEQFWPIIEEEPKHEACLEALVWISRQDRRGVYTDRTLSLIEKHHIESQELGSVCQGLVYTRGASVDKFLRKVLEKSPSREARGQACYTLAKRIARTENGSEAEKLFERVQKEFADLKHYRGTLGEQAARDLYEYRNLRIGLVAPEIEGEDIAGEKFKLSDYRGKVVVLDFWGHW